MWWLDNSRPVQLLKNHRELWVALGDGQEGAPSNLIYLPKETLVPARPARGLLGLWGPADFNLQTPQGRNKH